MLSCTGKWFPKAKSFRQGRKRDRDREPECSSIWLEWFKDGKSHQEMVLAIFWEHDHATVSWAEKKKKSVESSSTVTTGRVGTWFEGRDVCSASFGLLVWGSAFTVTHQKTALFCQSVLFLCVYTVRVTLWVSHSPLIFSISLRFHSRSPSFPDMQRDATAWSRTCVLCWDMGAMSLLTLTFFICLRGCSS